jgi:hypoxanthine phosphoribosyltransferase
VLVSVLRGAFVFVADLSRAITIPSSIEFVALAGYGGALGGQSAVRLIKDLDAPISGRDVLIAEDVVDTGLTLNYLIRTLELRGPSDIAVATLLDRPYRRLVDDLPIRYVGFTVPDEFFVGYGFDLDQRYRGLPDIHVVELPDEAA